jgi:hypothetical protein
MKIRIFNRTIEYKNKSYSIDEFKHEKILIGANFNLRKCRKGDLKRILLYTFMPYNWLNNKFIRGDI